MIRKQYKDKRNKAFIGAIIGAVNNIATGIASGIRAKKEAKRQEALYKQEAEYEAQNLREQIKIQQEANRKQQENIDKTAEAQNNIALNELAQSFTNDDYSDKLSYKFGGKNNKINSKMKRRKKAKWGQQDTADLISTVGATGSSVISGLVSGNAQSKLNAAKQKYEHQNDRLKNDLLAYQSFVPEEKVTSNYITGIKNTQKEEYTNDPVNNKLTYDQMELAKLGIRKRRK